MSVDQVLLSGRRTVDELIQAIRARAVRRVLVVDAGGRLSGLVALDDLVAMLADPLEALAAVARAESGALGVAQAAACAARPRRGVDA